MFLKFFITLNEKTKIDVSLSHFDPNPSKKTREDKEAQIELLTNMKLFLTEQVQQSEQKLSTNMKDITILKEMLRIEKNMNQKKEQIIQSRDKDLKEAREAQLENSSEQLTKINDLDL